MCMNENQFKIPNLITGEKPNPKFFKGLKKIYWMVKEDMYLNSLEQNKNPELSSI